METRLGAVRLVGRPIIQRARGSVIRLGMDVTLVASPRGNPAGICHPVVLATLLPGAVIEIGSGCGLSGAAVCAARSVTVGPHCLLGVNAAVYDTDFHPTDAARRRVQTGIDAAVGIAPVSLDEDVWLGANVTVLKGVRVGARSIVAAGSVVTRDVPADCVAGGVPAQVVSRRGPT